MSEQDVATDGESVDQLRDRLVETINEGHDEAERNEVLSSHELGRMLEERRARRRVAHGRVDALSR